MADERAQAETVSTSEIHEYLSSENASLISEISTEEIQTQINNSTVADDSFTTSVLPAIDLLYSYRNYSREARVRKGYLVAIYDPVFGFAFPINPQEIKTSKKSNFVKHKSIGQSSPDLLWTGSEERVISFSLIWDAYTTDFLLASTNNNYVESTQQLPELSKPRKGLRRILSQLELFNYPGDWFLKNGEVHYLGDYEPPPKAIFGYGDDLYLEVYVNSDIEIIEFNKNLEPVRARVNIELSVIDESISFINRKHLARKIEKSRATIDMRWKKSVFDYYSGIADTDVSSIDFIIDPESEFADYGTVTIRGSEHLYEFDANANINSGSNPQPPTTTTQQQQSGSGPYVPINSTPNMTNTLSTSPPPSPPPSPPSSP